MIERDKILILKYDEQTIRLAFISYMLDTLKVSHLEDKDVDLFIKKCEKLKA